MIGDKSIHSDCSEFLVSAEFCREPRSLLITVNSEMSPEVGGDYYFRGKHFKCIEIVKIDGENTTFRSRGLKFELKHFNNILINK